MFLDDRLPFSGVCYGFTQKFTLDGSELKALIGEKDVNCEISANQNPVSVPKSAEFYVILKNIIDRIRSQWLIANTEEGTFICTYVMFCKQNRSTEGCSKLKRSVDMTSSGKNGLKIRTNASPKWDRTRCPEE